MHKQRCICENPKNPDEENHKKVNKQTPNPLTPAQKKFVELPDTNSSKWVQLTENKKPNSVTDQ